MMMVVLKIVTLFVQLPMYNVHCTLYLDAYHEHEDEFGEDYNDGEQYDVSEDYDEVD